MATTDLERLVISVEANTSKIESQLEKLIGSVDGSFNKVKESTNTMVTAIETGFDKAGEVLTSFFAVEKIEGFIESLGEAATKLQGLSERTGQSVESLQKLEAAGRQSNITSDEMANALDILARNLGRSGTAQSDLGRVMRQFGIEPGKDLMTTLLAVSEAVQKAATRTDEARIVQAAFGRSTSELIGFLRQGPDAIRAISDGFTNVISAEAVEKLAKFSTAWNELGVTFTNIAAGPASVVVTGLSQLLKDLQQGNWEQRLQALTSLLTFGMSGKGPLIGDQESQTNQALNDLDKLIAKRQRLQDMVDKAGGYGRAGAQVPSAQQMADIDAQIEAKQQQAIESSVSITPRVGASGKPYGSDADVSALDQYIAKLKLSAEIAGMDADQKARANELIAAATAKLTDEGNVHKVLLDSMKAVTDELGKQAVAKVDALRIDTQANAIALSTKQLKEQATAAISPPQPINESDLAAQVAKDNLASLTAKADQIRVDERIAGAQEAYLDNLKMEVTLASLMPQQREQELAVLQQKKALGVDFKAQNATEITDLVKQKQAAQDLVTIQTAAISDIANFGDLMEQSGGKFVKTVEQMALSVLKLYIQMQATKALTSSFGGGSGGGTDILGSLLSGASKLFGFAGGGNPPVGVPSLVGENGPELFVPQVPGTIYPNGTGPGGGGDMHFQINVNGARGNAEIRDMVSAGVQQGIATYDRHGLPGRVNQLVSDPGTFRLRR